MPPQDLGAGESVAKIAAVLAAFKRLMEPASEPPEIPLS
jgi:hypothetical protein